MAVFNKESVEEGLNVINRATNVVVVEELDALSKLLDEAKGEKGNPELDKFIENCKTLQRTYNRDLKSSMEGLMNEFKQHGYNIEDLEKSQVVEELQDVDVSFQTGNVQDVASLRQSGL